MKRCKKVFILAAGNCSRWNGICKQLIQIDGEPLIHRTVRLIRECDENADIYIVSTHLT
jgi:choline kinase